MTVVVGYGYSLLKRIVIINLLCVLLNTFVDLVSSCVTYRNSLGRNTCSRRLRLIKAGFLSPAAG